jgi:hypothetical protein
MSSFTHYAKTARNKYFIGKHKEAIADYREAINLLDSRIRQLNVNTNERNRYVKVF